MTIKSLIMFSLMAGTNAACPFVGSNGDIFRSNFNDASSSGDGGVPEGGYEAVVADLKEHLVKSQDFWPADFGHYGPLMIRLAWHCSGSYRSSDGRGGCDGGRIRYDPELSWPDNANLNMALKLLEPIKNKYGCKLSWGDLIILAANAAIESMGGPVLGFCGGRIDDGSGADSLKLGPSEEQEQIAPCDVNGKCQHPLGPTTVGLIYVNPEGPMGEPNPALSVESIRDSFARMDMNDTETVALIGGGHAFGKVHGACAESVCGRGTDLEGKGPNTVTSGFEGVWTTQPTVWSNEYFHNLLAYEYQKEMSPAGRIQWVPTEHDAPDITMLTSDLALINDPIYKEIVQEWAQDVAPLEVQFAHAWYKLTTRDMGPVSRCLGDSVPPAQDFQMPLPQSPETLPDFVPVRSKLQEFLNDNGAHADLVNLAYQCASTYRHTDHLGGCNGARIRFSPEADWPSNAGTRTTLRRLQGVKDMFPDISWSDLIVLGGQVAIEDGGGQPMPFCGGRVDAQDGTGSDMLAPRTYFPAVVSVRDDMQVKGLTAREIVALAGRPSGPKMSNEFFKSLLDFEIAAVQNTTELVSNSTGEDESQESSNNATQIFSVEAERADPTDTFTAEQLALIGDAEFKLIVQEFADDEELFKEEFSAAWTNLVTADRFSGPMDNLCTNRDDKTLLSS